MAPSKMKALVTVGDGTVKLTEVDVPTVEPGYCLVKVVAVAQNPTDCELSLSLLLTSFSPSHPFCPHNPLIKVRDGKGERHETVF